MSDADRAPARWPFAAGLLALLALGVAIRLGRFAVAWNYWAIDYVAYAYGHWADLEAGRLPWTRLVRLHPGQYALLFALLLKAGLSLRALFALPLLAGAGATAAGALALRRAVGSGPALLFAGLMALSPIQAHYGLELNNYPWFQLAGATVLIAGWAAWQRPSRGRLVALGVATAAALHTHFFAGVPLAALGVAALATRRWRVAGALAAGLAAAAPVLWAALSLPGDPDTYSQPAERGWALVRETWWAWDERFGGPWSLGAAALALAVAAGAALRRRETRGPAVWLFAALALLTVQNYAGFLTGAVRIWQTPYWLLPSGLALALIALGAGAGGRGVRVALALLAAAWLPYAVERAVAPRAAGPGTVYGWDEASDEVVAVAEPPDVDALRAELEEVVQGDDMVLYLWEPWFINDQPHRWDPLFGVFRPGELRAWVPDDRFGGYAFRYGERATAVFVNMASVRRGDADVPLEPSLFPGDVPDDALTRGEALYHRVLFGLRNHRRIHLLFAGYDPAIDPPQVDVLEDLVAGFDGRWEDRRTGAVGLVTIHPPKTSTIVPQKRLPPSRATPPQSEPTAPLAPPPAAPR